MAIPSDPLRCRHFLPCIAISCFASVSIVAAALIAGSNGMWLNIPGINGSSIALSVGAIGMIPASLACYEISSYALPVLLGSNFREERRYEDQLIQATALAIIISIGLVGLNLSQPIMGSVEYPALLITGIGAATLSPILYFTARQVSATYFSRWHDQLNAESRSWDEQFFSDDV